MHFAFYIFVLPLILFGLPLFFTIMTDEKGNHIHIYDIRRELAREKISLQELRQTTSNHNFTRSICISDYYDSEDIRIKTHSLAKAICLFYNVLCYHSEKGKYFPDIVMGYVILRIFLEEELCREQVCEETISLNAYFAPKNNVSLDRINIDDKERGKWERDSDLKAAFTWEDSPSCLANLTLQILSYKLLFQLHYERKDIMSILYELSEDVAVTVRSILDSRSFSDKEIKEATECVDEWLSHEENFKQASNYIYSIINKRHDGGNP